MVYCTDVVELIARLAELRGLDPLDLVEKVGVDCGKGFLKVVLSMYNPLDTEQVAKKRRLRTDGVNHGGHTYRLLGKRRVMVLAMISAEYHRIYNETFTYFTELTTVDTRYYQ